MDCQLFSASKTSAQGQRFPQITFISGIDQNTGQ
jgi:hypothetical protein